MAKTLAQYKLHAQHAVAVSGSTLPPGTTADAASGEIVNEAGRLLYGAWPWKFRERPPASLSLTINVEYVAMPADYGELIGIEYDSLSTSIVLTDFQDLMTKRAQGITPVGYIYWAAIVQPSQTLQTSAMPAQRLELYPTPTASASDVIKVMYRADWRELTDDTHYASIPLWCETLLIEFIRAVAEGYMNRHGDETGIGVVSMTDRLDEIQRGVLFQRAVEKDALTQPHYGVVANGLINSLSSSTMSVVRPDSADIWPQGTPWIT